VPSPFFNQVLSTKLCGECNEAIVEKLHLEAMGKLFHERCVRTSRVFCHRCGWLFEGDEWIGLN
jgi:uncharacterized protein with PIN domain